MIGNARYFFSNIFKNHSYLHVVKRFGGILPSYLASNDIRDNKTFDLS